MIEQYNSSENFDNINPLTQIFQDTTSNNDEYRQKLLEKFETNKRNDDSSFLDTIEKLRREQRVQLERVERDYYNQKSTLSSSVDVPTTTQENQIQNKTEPIVTTKPPIPKTSKQLPSPVFLTEERAKHHMHRRSMSSNVVRRHDDEIGFCPHRASTGNPTATTVDDLTTNHINKQIQNMWKEFDLEDYIDNRK